MIEKVEKKPLKAHSQKTCFEYRCHTWYAKDMYIK